MPAPTPTPILHVDMDAFFASIEIRDRPQLVGLPVCVGGSAEKRGVIAAASYVARTYGVHSAMPTARALKLCPELVLLPPRFELYTSVSREVMAIFQRYTPVVEPLSLDEAFLDVSGSERLFGDAVSIGGRIKSDIVRETGLVASIGVAPSKFLAKLASDLDKPDGFRVILEHEVRQVLDPLPVSKIFGVGPRTAKRLEALGVHTVSDLSALDRADVQRRFGASGIWIHDLANGIDPRRVTTRRVEKSHGMERTFPEDISDREELLLLLFEFCEEVSYELRLRGLRGRTVTLKARYSDFRTITRSKTVDLPANQGSRIYAVARELFGRVPAGALRLLGVQVSNLSDVRAPVQASLFGEPEPTLQGGPVRNGKRRKAELDSADPLRQERASRAADNLRQRFGRGTVVPASLLGRVGHGVRARTLEGE